MMKRPGFFIFYTPESSGTQMQIPMPFITCIARALPKKVYLRDRFYNMWCVKPEKVGEKWYFTKGWRRFVRDNALKACEYIVFDYFEKDVLDFKILGQNQCETVGAGALLYIANDETDYDLNDVSDDEGGEDEEEEWDDDDCCEDEENLSKKWPNGDDHNRIDGGMFVKKEPKSEEDNDDHRGGMYKNVRVKKEPEHERDDGLCIVRQEPKSDDDGHERIYKYVRVKKEPRQERDDSLFVKQAPRSQRYDDDRGRIYKNVRVKKESQHEGDDAVRVKKEPQHEGDDGCDEALDDYIDDDAHNDIENHVNMIKWRSPQTLSEADTENDDDAFVEKEPPSEANADAAHGYDDKEVEDDADHGGDADEETEDANYMLSQENEHEEDAPNPANRDEQTKRKRASVFPRYYGMEIFDLGLAPRPTNPFFITHVSPRRKGDLFIPAELIKDHHLEMPKPEMILVDPQGREFRGKYKKWKDGRTLYSKGWRTLWILNGVSLEDYCICEFHQGGNGLYLKVNIVYVNGGPPICLPRIEGNGDKE